MTRPQPRSTMPSTTCLLMLNRLSRLVRMTASQLTLSIFLKVMSRVMPALLTRTSTAPTFCVHLGDGAGARVHVGDVAGDGGQLVAGALHARQPLVVGLVAGRVGDDDPVAGIGHLGRDRLAEPAHAAGDEHHATASVLPCHVCLRDGCNGLFWRRVALCNPVKARRSGALPGSAGRPCGRPCRRRGGARDRGARQDCAPERAPPDRKGPLRQAAEPAQQVGARGRQEVIAGRARRPDRGDRSRPGPAPGRAPSPAPPPR